MQAPHEPEQNDVMVLSRAFVFAGDGENDRDGAATKTALLDVVIALRRAWGAPLEHLEGFGDELARAALPGTDGVAASIRRIEVVPLYLAYLCRTGHAAALARFDRDYIATLAPVIARLRSDSAFIEEVQQCVRTKLLTASEGAKPKLIHYTGLGDLATWVRVVALREAVSILRRGQRSAHDDHLFEALEDTATGLDTAAVRAELRVAFRDALHAAFSALLPEQRNLLRLHHLHGLTVDELGKMLGIHRSAAARRVAKARESVLSQTRLHLLRTLQLSRDDFERVFSLVRSHLDLSLDHMLGS